ncbi:hypothetical protein G6045_08530 [Streptomyces sp. YC504]|uniref:Ig-like domain-containing protein n=1 Tax=Streptomyces mesophilus TaxID=1775132 RepID=A0A6G4XER0_9ACTN|nr:hypothetical protein [Streptomyces mesophilus]NGO75723.1 hypothetical protein [Streptomyces mesophilus]
MVRQLRHAVRALFALFTAMFAITALAAAPAHAVDSDCKTQSDITVRPDGNSRYTQVSMYTCITYDDGTYYAGAWITWTGGGGGDRDGSRVFDGFKLQVRLEQYTGDSDVTRASETCDYRGLINTQEWPGTGTQWYSCAVALGHSRTGTWSTDGKVVYNVDRDDQGDFTRQLMGTRRID